MLASFALMAVVVALATVLVFCACAASAAEPQRPNILIILTDDQGYADLGCFGNAKNKTPRLDRLAEQGTRFTRID